ncbi:flagellar basal body P-ring formation chaperone FlgA [Vibrio astriarenae]
MNSKARVAGLFLLFIYSPVAMSTDVDILKNSLGEYITLQLKHKFSQPFEIEINYRFSSAVNTLPTCEHDPDYSSRSQVRLGTQKWQISCAKPSWTLSARTTTQIEMDVVSAAKNLKKNQRIEQDDLRLQRSVLKQEQSLFSSPIALIGSKVKRDIPAGKILSAVYFYPNYAIEKGQKVTIIYQGETFKVSTPGVALESGFTGDRIMVGNANSNKRVDATIRNAAVVEVSAN